MAKIAHDARTHTLEAAIIVADVAHGFGSSRLWPALRDLRKGHARTLGLAGVILCEGERVIYGVEGDGRYLDRFIQMLHVSPCESGVRLLQRRSGQVRTYRFPGLTAPTPGAEERAWLRAEMDRPAPDVATLSSLLAWLASRHAEMFVSGGHADVLARTDPFPFPEPKPEDA